MQRHSERVTRAIRPLMTLCWVALVAACSASSSTTPAPGQAQPNAAAAAPASSACDPAASPVQALMCRDPSLAALDTALARSSAAAQATLDAAGQSRLQAEQQRWQQHTRDLCADVHCLQQVHADRIRIVSSTREGLVDQDSCIATEGQTACVDVMILRDPNSQLANFNNLMAQNGQKGTLLGCSAATNLAAGHNDLFAANCTLEADTGRSNVQVCSNQMVGDFAIEPAPAAYGDQANRQLIAFTQAHCAG